jgi:hypothetical protein
MGVLARTGELGVQPEVFHETTGKSASYPPLDIWHDARGISEAEARRRFPAAFWHEVVDERTANDVGVWGDKSLSNDNYEEPFEINGEEVDLGNLPPLGDNDT